MNAISTLQCVSDDDKGTPARHPSAHAVYGSVPAWGVFSTHSQSERLAASELTRAGYTTYLPLIAVRRRDRVVKTMTRIERVPLFSGYGFVLIDGPWVPIRYTSGVRDLLMNGNRPASIPTALIERLRAEDDARCELGETRSVLPKGAAVAIVDGPMQSLPGVVMSCDGVRTQVRVAMFGRFVPVWFDRSAIEAAAQPRI